MNNFRLYEKDLKILAELDKNSRATISQIAKNCRLSKEITNYRIKRMQEEGFIKGYKTIIDYYALGYNQYTISLDLHNIEENTKTDMVKEFNNMPRTEAILFIQGTTDMEVKFWTKNQKELLTTYSKIMEKYNRYIKDKSIYVTSRKIFLGHAYIHKNRIEEVMEILQPKNISPEEEQILLLIEKEPLAGIIEISKKLSMPPSTTTSRIKKMYSEKILRKAVPLIDTSMIGYSRYQINIQISDQQKKHRLMELLRLEKNVIQIEERMGAQDIVFNVDVKTAKDLDIIMNNLRINHPYIEDFKVKIIG
ncbi:MAG: Lrp/AsnC family transcriptional regulator [Candidatus Woesearchaeota archaeon]